MSPKTMPSAERAAIGRMDWTDGRLLSPGIDVTPSTPNRTATRRCLHHAACKNAADLKLVPPHTQPPQILARRHNRLMSSIYSAGFVTIVPPRRVNRESVKAARAHSAMVATIGSAVPLKNKLTATMTAAPVSI